MSASSATLEIRGVTRRFGKNTAVSDINISIPRGQMVGIIGRSGAGKSTLLRMINRLIDPSQGSIFFDGAEVSSLQGSPLRRWQRDCAMIFQQFNLVPRLDVLTNVLLGRLNHRSTALNMLGKKRAYRDVPFFWSQHYDVPVNYVGHAESFDRIQVSGDLAKKDALVAYWKSGKIVAVATVYRDRDCLLAEDALARGDQAALERLLR